MFQVIRNEPGSTKDENRNHHEQQKISSKIRFEISRINSEKIRLIPNHEAEIFQPFRDINAYQENYSRQKSTEEKKLEKLFPEG